MRYGSSEALSLDGYGMRSPQREASSRPSFDVHEGGGLDAQVRKGVSSEYLAKIKRVVIVLACLAVLGFARVAIATATVTVLQANVQLEHKVADADALCSDLKASKSALSSPTRIERIATQNYGMVLSNPEVLHAGSPAGAA